MVAQPQLMLFARRVRLCRLTASFLVLWLVLNALAQAQDFTYITNNGAIIITGYTGSGGNVTIPDTINGVPVAAIGQWAFFNNVNIVSVTFGHSPIAIGDGAFGACSLTSIDFGDGVTSIAGMGFWRCPNLQSLNIPDSITSLGDSAFNLCFSLTNVAIGKGLTNLVGSAFYEDTNLISVVVDQENPSYSSVSGIMFNRNKTDLIKFPAGLSGSFHVPESVSTISDNAFWGASGLVNVTFPTTIQSIGYGVFQNCSGLTGIYFEGSAPQLGPSVFIGTHATVYYLAGAAGWTSTFGGLVTAPWVLPYPKILGNASGFGIQSDGFGFTVSWATNASVIIEASSGIANSVWQPLGTNPLSAGTCYFRDPQWTNYSSRFYRIRSP